MDIKNELGNNSITLLIIPSETYNDIVFDVTGQISDGLCYITLNKTYKSLEDSLKEKNINTENIYFIDGITNKMLETKNTEKSIFIGSPNDLNELSISISKILEKGKIKYIFFDSLSTLLIYEESATVEKFFHTLSSKLKSQKIHSIFTILKKDSIPKLSMFADKVIDMSEGGNIKDKKRETEESPQKI